MLMTFADRTCGMTARYVSGKPTLATVQLDTHFVEAGKIGEILISKPHVVRSTRSLIFITTEVTVDKRCIAMASGVFKILKNEYVKHCRHSGTVDEAIQSASNRRDRVRASHRPGMTATARGRTPCNTANSAAAA